MSHQGISLLLGGVEGGVGSEGFVGGVDGSDGFVGGVDGSDGFVGGVDGSDGFVGGVVGVSASAAPAARTSTDYWLVLICLISSATPVAVLV